MKEKVAIIFGGKSVEHDISIITAMQAAKVLPEKFDYVFCYIDKTGLWWTADNMQDITIYENFQKKAKKLRQISLVMGENLLLIKKGNKFVHWQKVCAVLNCCHGNGGEDGALQGVLKMCDVPVTCAGVTSSALCMDKAFMKDVLLANKIKTPEYVVCKKGEFEKSAIKKLKFPLVVKPANLGSSIGISVCREEGEIDDAIELAFEFDRKIVVEKMVENLREFNCACFKFHGEDFISCVNEVTNKGDIFSFEDKYLSSSSTNQETHNNLANKIKKLTQKVYNLFDCKGVVRVDFLYDEVEEELYVNEINSIPGSLAFYLFKDFMFADLLEAMIGEALDDFKEEKKLVKGFESTALQIFENASSTSKSGK